MGVTELVIELKALFSTFNLSFTKLKLRVFLTAYAVGMVTSNVRKIITTYLALISHLFDTIIVAATVKRF